MGNRVRSVCENLREDAACEGMSRKTQNNPKKGGRELLPCLAGEKTANRTRSWNAKNSLFGPLFPSIKNVPNRSGRFFFLFFLPFFFRQTHKFSPSVFLPPPFYGKTAEEEESVSIFVLFFFEDARPVPRYCLQIFPRKKVTASPMRKNAHSL